MQFAEVPTGKRLHIAEHTLSVIAPNGRTHAFIGDNCPPDSYVAQIYLPFTWCGLHIADNRRAVQGKREAWWRGPEIPGPKKNLCERCLKKEKEVANVEARYT